VPFIPPREVVRSLPVSGLWRTSGGVIVESRGTPIESNGRSKIACFRKSTGGWHGWLNVRDLETVH